MLYQNDGHPPFLVYIEDEPCHVLGFFQIHTCHGLIQKQDLWSHRQGPGQFHPLLQTIWQRAYDFFANGLYFQQVDDAIFDFAAKSHFLFLGSAPIKSTGEEA